LKTAAAPELPGIDPKQVDLRVEEGILAVRGEKLQERTSDDDKKLHLWERSYGSFQRSFTLPTAPRLTPRLPPLREWLPAA
jgi:HSP20 family protein